MAKCKVSPLVGIQSITAFQAFNLLVLGVKMLPGFAGIPYATFLESIYEKSEAEQESVMREAVAFGEVKREEALAFLHFCRDANGIPYGKHNIDSVALADLFEMIVAVCMEIARMKTSLLVTDEEKKK